MDRPADAAAAPPALAHFIAGRETATPEAAFGDVFDPATGRVSARVPLADRELTRSAVTAAAEALPGWAGTPALRRARVMFRFRDLVEQNAEALARVISSQHGKLHDDAMGEVTRGLEVVEFACGIPHLLKGEFSDNVGTGVDSWS